MHPEIQDTAQFLEKYPHMESFVEAITTHLGSGASRRSLGSIRSNVKRAYAFMTSQEPSSKKRKLEESSPADSQSSKVQRIAESEAIPASLVRPLPGADERRAEPVLEQLASEREMNAPFGKGKETEPTGEAVENTRDPVPTYSQRAQNFPNLGAITTSEALDMADENPVKPHKELSTLPVHVDNAILSQQENYYLEHRNTNSLAQTTLNTPATALTTNNGDGVREGIRRRDDDVEMEVEAQEQRLEEKSEEGIRGGRGGRQAAGKKAKGPLPGQATTEAERQGRMLTKAIQWLGKGVDSLSNKVATNLNMGYLRKHQEATTQKQEEWVAAHQGMTDENGNVLTEAQLRSMARKEHPYDSISNQAKYGVFRAGVDIATDTFKGIYNLASDKMEANDILAKAQKEGKDIHQFLQEQQNMEENLAGKTGPAKQVEEFDELRPFMPIGGASDVELRPGENEQKLRTEALFNDYKPPNWPLGGLDNKIHMQNLILLGIKWESPLDSIPPVLSGGSLLQGAQEYGTDLLLPDAETLQLEALKKQIEFKVPGAGSRMMRKTQLRYASEFHSTIVQDVKFLFNPMAQGVNNPHIYSANELNPLSTPLHENLRIGGSEPLRNLYGPCDAYSMMTQPGAIPPIPPMQTYVNGKNYNLYGARPQYH